MTKRALTMLNETGDTTIIWEEEQDAAMAVIIEKKMAEGITFFIIEPRFGGFLPPKRVKATDAATAMRHRALSIRDEDLAAFVGIGSGEMVPTPAQKVKTVRKARTPKEVASAESVGVRPLQGG